MRIAQSDHHPSAAMGVMDLNPASSRSHVVALRCIAPIAAVQAEHDAHIRALLDEYQLRSRESLAADEGTRELFVTAPQAARDAIAEVRLQITSLQREENRLREELRTLRDWLGVVTPLVSEECQTKGCGQ